MRFSGYILIISAALSATNNAVSAESLSFSSTSFIPPASPTRGRTTTTTTTAVGTTEQPLPPSSSWFQQSAPQMAPAIIRVGHTQLYSKKKKAAPAAAKKIQVKMLKHVAGTGQAGQVVNVTPAFFNNKLRPTKSAVVISDEQVEQEEAAAAAEAKEKREKAEALKEKIAAITLTITRKAGPDGQLFGGIGPKVIVEELKSRIEDDYLSSKSVKITAVTDEDGKKMRGDIKHTGNFGATIALSKDISAKLPIVVEDTG